jgi:two-component system chemotaxis response regulator CheB
MGGKIKVLVVDDSAFARVHISRVLASDPQIEVVGNAKNGIEAIEKVRNLRPDVVTLDVTMPEMDGIEALERIMTECPVPVVMLSALTGENTGATIEALEKGAVDFFLKSSSLAPTGDETGSFDIINKVKVASRVSPYALKRKATPSNCNVKPVKRVTQDAPCSVKSKVLVIGCSTGGPRALSEIVPRIPANIPASILIVQHMPAGFTRSLAERLNGSSEIAVKEAESGDRLERGKALLAPGGFHMVIDRSGVVSLNEDPQVCGVRPSVDVTMNSIASRYGSSIRAVVLTGMGSDGTNGSRAIRQAGGKIVVEHESTCAVYGMPRSIVEAGLADEVVPLPGIAGAIARICGE